MDIFASKLEGADMSVKLKEKMSHKSNIYFVSAVWLLVRDFWRWVVSCTWFLGVHVPRVSSSNRKWQEASQQIQTLQASQSLLAEYEQKIKVRNFVTYIKLWMLIPSVEDQDAAFLKTSCCRSKRLVCHGSTWVDCWQKLSLGGPGYLQLAVTWHFAFVVSINWKKACFPYRKVIYIPMQCSGGMLFLVLCHSTNLLCKRLLLEWFFFKWCVMSPAATVIFCFPENSSSAVVFRKCNYL